MNILSSMYKTLNPTTTSSSSSSTSNVHTLSTQSVSVDLLYHNEWIKTVLDSYITTDMSPYRSASPKFILTDISALPVEDQSILGCSKCRYLPLNIKASVEPAAMTTPLMFCTACIGQRPAAHVDSPFITRSMNMYAAQFKVKCTACEVQFPMGAANAGLEAHAHCCKRVMKCHCGQVQSVDEFKMHFKNCLVHCPFTKQNAVQHYPKNNTWCDWRGDPLAYKQHKAVCVAIAAITAQIDNAQPPPPPQAAGNTVKRKSSIEIPQVDDDDEAAAEATIDSDPEITEDEESDDIVTAKHQYKKQKKISSNTNHSIPPVQKQQQQQQLKVIGTTAKISQSEIDAHLRLVQATQDKWARLQAEQGRQIGHGNVRPNLSTMAAETEMKQTDSPPRAPKVILTQQQQSAAAVNNNNVRKSLIVDSDEDVTDSTEEEEETTENIKDNITSSSSAEVTPYNNSHVHLMKYGKKALRFKIMDVSFLLYVCMKDLVDVAEQLQVPVCSYSSVRRFVKKHSKQNPDWSAMIDLQKFDSRAKSLQSLEDVQLVPATRPTAMISYHLVEKMIAHWKAKAPKFTQYLQQDVLPVMQRLSFQQALQEKRMIVRVVRSDADVCSHCNEEASKFILCDFTGCEGQFHMKCVDAQELINVNLEDPNEEWICQDCTVSNAL